MRRRRIVVERKKLGIKLSNNLIIENKIAFIVPITSRKRDYKNIKDTDFCKILYQSFLHTSSEKYDFSFYLGYDHDDPFYSTLETITKIKELDPRIHMIKMTDLKGKVGKIWSILAEKALEDGNDWLYQIGDDIEILDSGWEDAFTKKLKDMDLRGVVGPNDINTHRKLLTQSFVHLTHLFFFDTYYPPIINNWYIDDWITISCDQYHFLEFRVKNSGGSPRYNIDDQEDKYIKLAKKDRKKFLEIKEKLGGKKVRTFKSSFTKMFFHGNEIYLFSPKVKDYEYVVKGSHITPSIIYQIDYQNRNCSFKIQDITFQKEGTKMLTRSVITEDDISEFLYNKNYKVLTRKFHNSEQENTSVNTSIICFTGTNKILNEFFESGKISKMGHFVLVTIEMDHFDLDPKWLEYSNLKKWYTWNKPFEHEKLFSLPIGLNKERQFNSFCNFNSNYDKNSLLLINFSQHTHPERKEVFEIAKKWNFAVVGTKLPNENEKYFRSLSENCDIKVEETSREYFNYLSDFKFVLSPRGEGIDCHRTWEALYVGTVPIVKSSSIDDLYQDLPILVISDWDQINKEFLNEEYLKIMIKIKNNEYNLEKLKLEYWLHKIEGEKINFITYGNDKYYESRKRLVNEAQKFGGFDSVKDYSEHDLTSSFKNKYKHILKESRGGGYWIWKLDIIKQSLSSMGDGDLLIYLDAGCSLNIEGKKRFNEYLELLRKSKHDILSFQMLNLKEKEWATKEVFEHLEIKIDSPEANSGQHIATALIMRKGHHLRKIMGEMDKILEKDADLFTDKYNKKQEGYFKDNRHDQSIFSLLRKKYGSEVIKGDETWFKDFNSEEARKCPIHAKRAK